MINLLEHNESLRTELKEHLDEFILNSFEWSDIVEDTSELHQQAFNTDYYIIGYYNAEQWLKKHNINVFEGIDFVQNYERDMFGDEGVRIYDNAETLVNMITYIVGEELINELV